MGFPFSRCKSPPLQAGKASEAKSAQVAAHHDEEASPESPETEVPVPPSDQPSKSDGGRRETPETAGPADTEAVDEDTLTDIYYQQILCKATGRKSVSMLQHEAGVNQVNRKNNGRCEVSDHDFLEEWDSARMAIEDLASALARDRKLSSRTRTIVLRPRRDWSDLTLKLQDELHRWTPRAKEIFEDPSRVHFLYAARIWHTLDEQLFSGGPENVREWLGPHWARFAELKEAFKANGHDQPWKKGDMDGAYNVWRWYTAKLLYLTFDRFPTDRLIKAVCRQVMRDLEPLVGPMDDERAYCQAKVELALEFLSDVFKWISLSLSKYWLVWQPERSKNMWGFPVASTTDEGYNVFMRTPSRWVEPPGTSSKKDDLDGEEVHLVVSPALAVTRLYDEGPSHHYMCPMTVIIAGHLDPSGGLLTAPSDKDGSAPFPTTSTADKGPDREDKSPDMTPVEGELPLGSPTAAGQVADDRAPEAPLATGDQDRDQRTRTSGTLPDGQHASASSSPGAATDCGPGPER